MKKISLRAAVAAGAVLWMAFMPSLGVAQDIRLMSYNILHGKGADGQVDIPRIAAVISRENPILSGCRRLTVACRVRTASTNRRNWDG